MPAISVIVPVYNVEKYIHRCVDSILAQTLTDFDLILVDDGSPDNCGAICDEYAAKNSRIHVIHQENGGLSAARNAGIDWAFANSDSQRLTFIDSDDWVHPNYLEALYDAQQSTGLNVSVCGYAETDGEEPEIEPNDFISVLVNPEDFFVEHNVNATVACGKLYRKECFSQIRYPVGKIHEDEYVTYRILFQFSEIAYVKAPLYAYYANLDGITKRPWTPKRMDALDAFDGQRLYFTEHHFHRAHQKAVGNLMGVLQLSIFNLEKYGDAAAVRKLRRKLAYLVIAYRRDYPFEQKNYWLYEQAFPKAMYLYWTAKGVANKLKRSLRICRKSA